MIHNKVTSIYNRLTNRAKLKLAKPTLAAATQCKQKSADL